MKTALADGHFHKVGKLIPNLQFRRKLAHDITENKIGVETVDSGRLRRSTCTPSIVPCKLQKVKQHEDRYKKGKKNKKSNRNIKNRYEPTLKLTTNGLEVFVNAPWDSFCEIDVSSNIQLRLLLTNKYCN